MKLSFKLITKILVFFFVLLTLQANALQIGDKAPNFKADTTLGELDFYDWSQSQWVILLSHPGDFTPVCTTELAEAAKLQPLLKKRNAKILTLSADSVEDHLEWVDVINKYKNKTTTTDDLKNLLLGIEGDTDVNFPIISDPDLKVATLYGMYHPKALPNASSLGGENKSTIKEQFGQLGGADLFLNFIDKTLIPFVENSFKHGAIIDGVLVVKILIKNLNDTLYFEVENSIIDKPNNEAGIGIENIKKRLVMLYPNAHTLIIENNNDTFKVGLTIELNKLKSIKNV